MQYAQEQRKQYEGVSIGQTYQGSGGWDGVTG